MLWPTFYAFSALFWLLFLIMYAIIFIIAYVFAAYAFSRLGRKFGVGSFVEFLIPVYNIMLLCDCAKINRWVTAAIVFPTLAAFAPRFFIYHPYGFFARLISLAVFAASFFLWGKIAERLGKNFWLWGLIASIFIWIPTLILAFDSSVPTDGKTNGMGTNERDSGRYQKRYIDI